MPATLLEQVQKQVATIEDARTKAIAELEGGWYTSDQDQQSANTIKALKSVIDPWKNRGVEAAKANKLPGTNGWPGWFKAGVEILDGIKAISDVADGAELQAIVEVVKEAPKHVGEDISRGAKAAAKVVGETAGAVAGAAGSVATAALLPLWPVLLIAGLGAAVYFGGMRKLTGGG